LSPLVNLSMSNFRRTTTVAVVDTGLFSKTPLIGSLYFLFHYLKQKAD
jgi:hypothetical protein